MDLKTFISSSLVQIVEGVQDAQRQAPGLINPALAQEQGSLEKMKVLTSRAGKPVRDVEFDVAVTIAKEGEAKAEIGVVAAWLGKASAGASVKDTDQAVSRLKFIVPVALPSEPN